MTGKKRSVIISKGNIHDIVSAFLFSIRAIEADEHIIDVKYIAPKFEEGYYVVNLKGS